MTRLQGKIALITGASKGIGRAIAKRYIDEGAHVIAHGRDVAALENLDDYAKAKGSSTTILHLDLERNFEQIYFVANNIAAKFGKLDIFVGNAGVMGYSMPLTHNSLKDFDRIFNVNLKANFIFLKSLEPLLRAAVSPRAIFVTCAHTHEKSPYMALYNASKAALEMMVQTYANEICNVSPLKVNLVDPGIVATNLRSGYMPGEDATNLMKPEEISDIFVDLALETCQYSGELFYAQEKKVPAT